ncbi:hypothetical protein A3Q56_06568 [Intoshia linei]|uniref:EF-hand domain-containing protein n=1 Tax=Intoshia linei TaxID=1819745 RepID=A0A177AUN0_9BILA|nr:hypothetical protein A3Q56_06568 [Intoshia linei]
MVKQSRSERRKTRSRTRRATSNVFAMFSEDAIKEFKEAFSFIDANGDGFIDKEDLMEMFTSLDKVVDDDYIQDMLDDAPGSINFTMFLTLFGEKLNGSDPNDVLINAFSCFDAENKNTIKASYLKEIMTSRGDRWDNKDVEKFFKAAKISPNDNINYANLVEIMSHGHKEKK